MVINKELQKKINLLQAVKSTLELYFGGHKAFVLVVYDHGQPTEGMTYCNGRFDDATKALQVAGQSVVFSELSNGDLGR